MAGSTQEAFLKRVRVALSNHTQPTDLPSALDVARVIQPGGDVVALFLARVEEAKASPHRVRDEAELAETVAAIVREAGARTALVPGEAMPARDQIIARLQADGIQLLDPDDPDAAFVADVGITAASAAVAETASMSLTSGDGRRRLASLAVPCHIGIVRAEQIVPDLLDWAEKHETPPQANEVLVSAPSKTADIELSLVMGVHGPRYEHVVVLG